MPDINNEAVEKLRRRITSGRYPRGSRIPPERTLAQELGLTRATLRKALAVLEGEGLIWRHVGRGTFVGEPPQDTEIDIRPLVELTSPAEIMEVRLLIEPKIAALAAMRATRQEMDRMEEAVLRSENAVGFEDNEKWDLVLHEIIAGSTNNHLLETLFRITNQLRKGEVWGRMKEASLTPRRWKIYAEQHHELLGAIRDRNAVLAEELMRKHLEVVLRNFQNED